MSKNKTPEKKTINIDPELLISCAGYVDDVVNGYVAIYQNFQNILWTLRRNGVNSQDAAAATVEIINRAAAKAQAMVPHKDPFGEPDGIADDDNKKEESSSDDDTV